MCRAKHLAEQLAGICREVWQEAGRANRAVSEADKRVSEIYHEIETTHFSAARGYGLARRLQEALQVRRAAKLELETLQMLADTVRGLQPVPHKIDRKIAAYCQWTGRMPPQRLPEPAGGDAPLAS